MFGMIQSIAMIVFGDLSKIFEAFLLSGMKRSFEDIFLASQN
jgi:hypothetical protein